MSPKHNIKMFFAYMMRNGNWNRDLNRLLHYRRYIPFALKPYISLKDFSSYHHQRIRMFLIDPQTPDREYIAYVMYI